MTGLILALLIIIAPFAILLVLALRQKHIEKRTARPRKRVYDDFDCTLPVLIKVDNTPYIDPETIELLRSIHDKRSDK